MATNLGSNPNAPFLRLTPALRRRIYLETGACSGQTINIGSRAQLPYGLAGTEFPMRCDFYSLLFVCRIIHAELSRTIYAENSIVVQQQSRKEGLQALRNLTTVSTSALRSLTIHLSGALCCLYRCCGVYLDVYQIPHRDCERKECLAKSESKDQEVLKDWSRTLGYITAHVKPFSLELYLICDVRNHETALQVVRPIIEFAKFKHCHIRLSHERSPALEELATMTVMRAIGGTTLHKTYPRRPSFLDLPREVRHEVLQYTDLVTPIQEILWNPKDGYRLCYCISEFGQEAEYFFQENSALRHSFNFRNCSTRSQVGCFCRRFHTVSSSSSMCHCWSPPTSLFLVCHEILDAARMVFFSKNRFIVTSANGPDTIAESTPERLESSVFLVNMVPFTSLRWLRSLELVFPPFEDDYMRFTEAAYSDWLQTLDNVKDHLQISKMDLHIHMADPDVDDGNVAGGRTYRPNLTKSQSQRIVAMYMRLLKTLPPLDNFSCFTMHLAVPWGWDQAGHHRPRRSVELWKRHEERRVHMQEVIGRLIIGDKIDQVLTNSDKRRKSQWLELAWTKYEQTIG